MKKIFRRHLNKPAIRQGSIVVVDQGVLSLATFIAGVLVARSTSTHEYALYVLGWSIILTAQGAFRNLIIVPLTVYAPRMDTDSRLIYQGSTLAHSALFSLTILIALVITNFLIHEAALTGRNTLSSILPIIALVIPALVWRELIRNVLLAQLRILASAAINILSTIMTVIVIGYLFLTDDLTLKYALWCFAVISGVTAAYMNYKFKEEFQINFKAIYPDFIKGWTISKWASLNVVGFIGMSQLYPWMLLYFIDHEAVAAYGACLAVASLISPIMRGANAYILPRISHGYKNKCSNKLRSLTTKSILALLIPYTLWMLIAVIYQSELVPLFYSEKYRGFDALFLLLALKISIDSTTSPLNSALQTAEMAGQTTIALIIGAVITIAIGPILIESYGVNGAGITALAATFASAAWKYKALRKVTD